MSRNQHPDTCAAYDARSDHAMRRLEATCSATCACVARAPPAPFLFLSSAVSSQARFFAALASFSASSPAAALATAARISGAVKTVPLISLDSEPSTRMG